MSAHVNASVSIFKRNFKVQSLSNVTHLNWNPVLFVVSAVASHITTPFNKISMLSIHVLLASNVKLAILITCPFNSIVHSPNTTSEDQAAASTAPSFLLVIFICPPLNVYVGAVDASHVNVTLVFVLSSVHLKSLVAAVN